MLRLAIISGAMAVLSAQLAADAGQRLRQKVEPKCTATAISKFSNCPAKRFRKAFPQQETLQPLYVDQLDTLLVPPLQGVLNSELGRVNLNSLDK